MASASTVGRSEGSLPAGKLLSSLVLLWLAGACLRLTVLAIPPVVPFLHADLGLSETEIGALSSLPALMFAVAAVPGSLLIARFGATSTLLAGLLLTAVASGIRGAVLDVGFLYATTILMAAGISIMQPALPQLVRAWFPSRVGFATAVYTNGLLVSEVVVVALTIPFVLPLMGGSWRLSFAFWALPVLATAALVAVAAPRAARTGTPAPALLWWPNWRSPLIWRLGLILGSVNTIYFSTNGFLPDYAVSIGRPDLISSALTSLNFSQFPASILMLFFAGRWVARPWAYVVTGSLSLLSLVGIMTMGGGWIVFWAGLLGFANAVTLILAFALPSLLSAPDDVHRTAAGMFTVSYSCAVIISMVCGLLWDATGLPTVGLAPIALCALVIIGLAPTVRRAGPRR